MIKPTAHVINLDRRPDRWIQCQRLWGQYFNLERFSAVDTPGNGALGCKQSHVSLVEKYLRDNSMIVVLEDDSVPTEFWGTIGSKCLSEAWDLCFKYNRWDYINCSPYLDLSPVGKQKSMLGDSDSPMFLTATYSHQTNFVIYNSASLFVLRASLSSPLPIDMFLGHHSRKQLVPVRLLATQHGGDSDVGHAFDRQQELYFRTEQMLEEARPTARNEWPSKSTMGDWSFREIQ